MSAGQWSLIGVSLEIVSKGFAIALEGVETRTRYRDAVKVHLAACQADSAAHPPAHITARTAG
jgi:hypothetical protein